MPDPAAPALETASRWRLLFVVVPALDARAGWRRRQRSMGDAEIEADLAMLKRVPAAIESWSDGNVRVVRAQVVVADEPLRRLARVGDGWWADPDALAPLLAPHLEAPRAFDSVVVLYASDGTPELAPAWGFT